MMRSKDMAYLEEKFIQNNLDGFSVCGDAPADTCSAQVVKDSDKSNCKMLIINILPNFRWE
jgi:hypothetical protein